MRGNLYCDAIYQTRLEKQKTHPAMANTLAQYCYPGIGHLSVAAIDTALVTKCLEPIWVTKNKTASRVECAGAWSRY
jgi:hypothetical protein